MRTKKQLARLSFLFSLAIGLLGGSWLGFWCGGLIQQERYAARLAHADSLLAAQVPRDTGECVGEYIVLRWTACTPDGRLAGQRSRSVRVSPDARILAIERDGSVCFPVEMVDVRRLP